MLTAGERVLRGKPASRLTDHSRPTSHTQYKDVLAFLSTKTCMKLFNNAKYLGIFFLTALKSFGGKPCLLPKLVTKRNGCYEQGVISYTRNFVKLISGDENKRDL